MFVWFAGLNNFKKRENSYHFLLLLLLLQRKKNSWTNVWIVFRIGLESATSLTKNTQHYCIQFFDRNKCQSSTVFHCLICDKRKTVPDLCRIDLDTWIWLPFLWNQFLIRNLQFTLLFILMTFNKGAIQEDKKNLRSQESFSFFFCKEFFFALSLFVFFFFFF